MNNPDPAASAVPFPLRKILPVIAVTLAVMLFITTAIDWYSNQVSLPRYCEDPQQALHYLEANLRQSEPAGDEPRKPYLIAAKLLFLIPQASGESITDYLNRVELELLQHCR